MLRETKSILKSVIVIMGISLVACGRDAKDDEYAVSQSQPATDADDAQAKRDFEFIAFGNGIYGLVGDVKKPAITICLSGASVDSKWKDLITDAVMKWIKPMRAWTESTLASTVNVIAGNTGCDATFHVVSGAWGVTQISNNPSVTVGPTVPYGVVIHEFGHAFGISDTYMNGTSGNCQPGQPQSLMCNISFSDLQPDDIAGMKKVFTTRYPTDVPPSQTPTPTPTPANPSDPNVPTPNTIDVDLAMAVRRARGHTFNLYMSAAGSDRAENGKMSYCVGDETTCDAKTGTYTDANFIGTRGNKAQIEIYKSKTSLTLSANTSVFVKYETAQGTKLTQFDLSR